MWHSKRIVRPCSVALLILTATVCAGAQNRESPIHITADLSEAPRKLFHAEIDLPVKEGPLTLTAAKWIPGTHSPIGPVNNIVGLTFTANHQVLEWRRDDVDLYQFHVAIPKGVTTLHVHLDSIITTRVSENLAVLEWEELLLYPANIPVRQIRIQPAVIVPADWGIGTALNPVNTSAYPTPASGSTTEFEATNVEQLEDTSMNFLWRPRYLLNTIST
jgi:predicted metalloprotease with PDZ domain